MRFAFSLPILFSVSLALVHLASGEGFIRSPSLPPNPSPDPSASYIYKLTVPFIKRTIFDGIRNAARRLSSANDEDFSRKMVLQIQKIDALQEYFDHSASLFIDTLLKGALFMEECSVPPPLAKIGVKWFKWNSLDSRGNITPEIHMVPAKNKVDVSSLETLKNAGLELRKSFLKNQWDIFAEFHTSMFVDNEFYTQALKHLLAHNDNPSTKDEDKIAFFGPVAREDSPGMGPYQLYIQYPGFPSVFELDAEHYNYEEVKKWPLCRVADEISGDFNFVQCPYSPDSS